MCVRRRPDRVEKVAADSVVETNARNNGKTPLKTLKEEKRNVRDGTTDANAPFRGVRRAFSAEYATTFAETLAEIGT